MRAYHAETVDGFVATIFGRSYEEAVTLFCVHYDVYMNRMPHQFSIAMVRRPRPGMMREHFEEAIARGVSGVGYYIQGRGWTILPAERVIAYREELPA